MEVFGAPFSKRQVKDFGIAVSNATRLNECWHELSEAFAARPAIEGDDVHWFQQAGASPSNEEWVHQVNSRNVAEITLRCAIRDHAFPIWLRLANGEVRADPNTITSISHKTLATGLYLTEDYPKGNLEGRPLWIKDADWQCFYRGVMASRYGEQVAAPADTELNDPLTLWLALELRRARTAFDKERKEHDADFEAKGLRKSGVWVKVTLESASGICVALADDTIAKATEYQSMPAAVADARQKVEDFTKEVANSAIPLAFAVSGETGLGGSVVKAAMENGQKLCGDVSSAFALADLQQARLSLQPTTLKTPRRRGRKPGSGSMADADTPLLAEMRQLIDAHKAFSPDGAAKLVAAKAVGASLESRATRLANRYRASEFNSPD